MGFEKYILCQLETHPAMTAQDIVKLCYQAAYGPGHLLADVRRAEEYFDAEFKDVAAVNVPLVESISDDYCRINLGAWKNTSMPSKWLFELFRLSADGAEKNEKLLLKYLETAAKYIEDEEFLVKYEANGMPAVHHSDIYRETENPSYRVVDRRLIRLLPVLQKAAEKAEEESVVVIAIDGRAGSGKSTMAEQLKKVVGGEIIRMDDFFLPMELRTAERLSSPGGNIHYERFLNEVLPAVKQVGDFSYRKFDCSVMDYSADVIAANSRFRIVEGAYSGHPRFSDYADIKVFSDVEPDVQMQRIIHRNGIEMAELFRTRWIPMEEAYFTAYGTKEKADVIV
ncbi:MAG: hypothetical protein E7430_01830 [Ruminococcaceae bacterium]|nr:hypothetical protein [Oscillospiraceae bacterium]